VTTPQAGFDHRAMRGIDSCDNPTISSVRFIGPLQETTKCAQHSKVQMLSAFSMEQLSPKNCSLFPIEPFSPKNCSLGTL